MSRTQRDIHRHLAFGLGTVAVLAALAFGWAARTELSGAVIAPGHIIRESAPAGSLAVEAPIKAAEMAKIRVGQPVWLRFGALKGRNAPELRGEVGAISAEIRPDPRGGIYPVRIEVAEAEWSRLGAATLLPGMPVEVFLETEPRTVASYVIEPLQDQLARTFRD